MTSSMNALLSNVYFLQMTSNPIPNVIGKLYPLIVTVNILTPLPPEH